MIQTKGVKSIFSFNTGFIKPSNLKGSAGFPALYTVLQYTSGLLPSLSEMLFSSFSQDAVCPPRDACKFSICRRRGRVAEVTL